MIIKLRCLKGEAVHVSKSVSLNVGTVPPAEMCPEDLPLYGLLGRDPGSTSLQSRPQNNMTGILFPFSWVLFTLAPMPFQLATSVVPCSGNQEFYSHLCKSLNILLKDISIIVQNALLRGLRRTRIISFSLTAETPWIRRLNSYPPRLFRENFSYLLQVVGVSATFTSSGDPCGRQKVSPIQHE